MGGEVLREVGQWEGLQEGVLVGRQVGETVLGSGEGF